MAETTTLGNLYWYHHEGWQDGSERWAARSLIGRGSWQTYKSVFATSDGVIYAIDWYGNLWWYRDDGWRDGSERWTGRNLVGTGWTQYSTVFATSNGILYAVDWYGNLWWYRHDGWRDGSERWTGRNLVGRGGWLVYTSVFATSDGILYGIERGNLYWYRHDGWQDGSERWTGRNLVGRTGWDAYTSVLATTQGIFFAVDNNVASQIKHIVYLMLENRSLDNVLGWLYPDGQKPDRVMAPPAYGAPDYNGLLPNTFYNLDASGGKHWIVRGTGGQLDVPTWDPYEEYEHINNQLFENEATPARGTRPTMGGFYKDFAAFYDDASQIMKTYTAADLPVLNGAARNWAVSDAYFSSVPTQTNCNRAFAATGNSLAPNSSGALEGWVNNHMGNWHDPFALNVVFNQRTMFNVLQDANKQSPSDWMIYYSEIWESYCFTRDMLSQLQDSKLDPHFAPIDTFFARAKDGKLPSVCFLEPEWGLKWQGIGWNGNDYHPPCNLGPGEQFVKRILDALQSSPCWNETLLIINFDEHGGTYDHVPPPWTAAVPWGGQSATPTPTSCEQKFGFDRFGVRVPLILVSPYIDANTVFRAGEIPYDHTSVIATILTMMGVPQDTWKLGNRVDNAPTFQHVLTRNTPRIDIVPFEASAAARKELPSPPALDPPPSGLQRGIALRILRHQQACRSAQPGDAVVTALENARTISELARTLAVALGSGEIVDAGPAGD